MYKYVYVVIKVSLFLFYYLSQLSSGDHPTEYLHSIHYYHASVILTNSYMYRIGFKEEW